MTSPAARFERIRVEAEDTEVEVFAAERFEIVFASARDPLKEANEDTCFVVDFGEHGAVLVVVDGMGGMKNGREAARVAIETIADALRQWTPEVSLRSTLVESFELAHENVTQACSGGGATVAAALIRGDQVQTIHAGDAEALVFGQKGRVKHRTPPHSPVGYAVQAGLVDESEAHDHPERHYVSNGLGLDSMTIEIGPRVQLSRFDTVVVASDGLTDNATTEEIVESLRAGSLLESGQRLLELCRSRIDSVLSGSIDSSQLGKPDDVTFAVLRRTS